MLGSLKVGTTTLANHLIAISDLDDETKRRHLLSHGSHLNMMREHLRVDGQEEQDFDVNDFVDKSRLLAFSFVRHPFERCSFPIT